MLTRLKVRGFKNLVNVDIEFGPFTCIAGVNGVGKSNLFDAIRFLSALADRPILEAALLVRDEAGRSTDLRGLFHRVGDHFAPTMYFEAEMIVPPHAIDDLGQSAQASVTFVRYKLELGWRATTIGDDRGSLELLQEELSYITRSDPTTRLGFKPSKGWRESVLIGSRVGSFISTVPEGDVKKIRLHQDKGRSSDPRKRGGRTYDRLAAELPRTVLSVANATESPTVLCARREMQAWRLLQLEPSALRRPDEFHAPAQLAPSGLHLPATLYRLANNLPRNGDKSAQPDSQRIYTQVSNRLTDLIEWDPLESTCRHASLSIL